jgi:D-sedoheptulose 7-phosphate isomerase
MFVKRVICSEIQAYWADFAAALPRVPFARLTQVAEELLACYARGGTIFVLGNGGSAATASHFACDLAKGTRAGGAPTFRVVPLTDNTPLITAWANDHDYASIFAEQLASLARPGDVALLISASGNSPNVLAAARAARAAGATTLAWTGPSGGRLSELADVVVRAPMGSIEQVEDAHVLFGHSLCVALREHLRREAGLRGNAPRDRFAHDRLVEQIAAAGGAGE